MKGPKSKTLTNAEINELFKRLGEHNPRLTNDLVCLFCQLYNEGKGAQASRLLSAMQDDLGSITTGSKSLSNRVENQTLVGKTKLPTAKLNKADIADTLLIFVCRSPDDAETAVGDLLENCAKVAARRSKWVTNLYFAWELCLLVVAKGKKRLVDATIGPLLEKWLKGSAS